MPIILVAIAVYFLSLPAPGEPPVPSGPMTEYSSLEELENWIGTCIPRPSYLPAGYEIKRIYQLGPKPERGKIPPYLYLLYSDEAVSYSNVISYENLSKALQTISKPGGYKLMLLLTHHTINRTAEDVKNDTLNYIKWVRENEKGADIEIIYINGMPAALERKSYGYTIV